MSKALLIIDMLVKDNVLPRWNELVKNQLRLLNAFHAAGHKVILVGGKKNGSTQSLRIL